MANRPTAVQTHQKTTTNNCRPRAPRHTHTRVRYLLIPIIEFVSHHFVWFFFFRFPCFFSNRRRPDRHCFRLLYAARSHRCIDTYRITMIFMALWAQKHRRRSFTPHLSDIRVAKRRRETAMRLCGTQRGSFVAVINMWHIISRCAPPKWGELYIRHYYYGVWWAKLWLCVWHSPQMRTKEKKKKCASNVRTNTTFWYV